MNGPGSGANERSHTVDQRGIVLPPTWCSRSATSSVRQVYLPERVWDATDRWDRVKERVLQAMDSARATIMLSTFILADEQIEAALLHAATRGVRIYLLLPTRERLEREPREGSDFDQRVLARHEALLKKLEGRVLIRSSGEFHAKVVLVDHRRGGTGYLLTGNLTSEGLTRNEELMVELAPAQAQAAFEALRWAAWEHAEHEVMEPGRLAPVKPLGLLEAPPGSDGVFGTVGPRRTLQNEVRRLIDEARSEIIVASFGWERDHPVVERLVERAREGLQVWVLARIRAKAMPALVDLREAGAEVLGFPHLHAKALWTDQGEGLIMTANLERRGLDSGFELGVRTADHQSRSLKAILGRWRARAAWTLQARPAVGDVLGPVKVWTQGRLAELEVHATLKVTLDAGASLPEGGVLSHPAHELEITRRDAP